MASDLGRIFRQVVTLAECGNYRKAASRLGITHSALSQAISRLEQSYGVPLFRRNGRRTVPTPCGQKLIEAARTSLASLEEAERFIARWRAMHAGEIRVGGEPTIVAGALGQAAAEALGADGGPLRVVLEPVGWEEALAELKDGQLDIHVDYKPDGDPADLEAITLVPVRLPPLTAVARPEHPLVRRGREAGSCPFPRLFEGAVIFNLARGWMHEALEKALGHKLEAALDQIHPLRDVAFACHLLERHDVVALLPREAVKKPLEAGILSEIEVDGSPFAAPLPGVVARNREIELHPAAQRIIGQLEMVAAPSSAPAAGIDGTS